MLKRKNKVIYLIRKELIMTRLLAAVLITFLAVGTADARIKRSTAAKRAFQKAYPCPSTGKRAGSCPGYVIDHVVPLVCGGADAPANMQWQTIAAGKAKDRWERSACGK
jgi:hypothetical protein